MRTIAIINQKGGVGKTTSAVNLSAALAEAGNRVCLIDLDPQAHATLHFGIALPESDDTIYPVLVGDVRLGEVRQKVDENLWVVPSHIDLAASELELATQVGREIILRDELEFDADQFDYCIMDCPPSLGVLTLNALCAATEVFLPLQPQYLPLHGLTKLLNTIELVSKRLNRDLRLSGVIYCMYDKSTKLAAEVIGDVESFLEEGRGTEAIWSEAKAFDTRIRRNIRLAEAPSFGCSIFQYAPNSNGAMDYRALAQEVMHGSLDTAIDAQVEEDAADDSAESQSILPFESAK